MGVVWNIWWRTTLWALLWGVVLGLGSGLLLAVPLLIITVVSSVGRGAGPDTLAGLVLGFLWVFGVYGVGVGLPAGAAVSLPVGLVTGLALGAVTRGFFVPLTHVRRYRRLIGTLAAVTAILTAWVLLLSLPVLATTGLSPFVPLWFLLGPRATFDALSAAPTLVTAGLVGWWTSQRVASWYVAAAAEAQKPWASRYLQSGEASPDHRAG